MDGTTSRSRRPQRASSAGSRRASIPSERLHEDDLVVAFRDIAPRAPTHILLIPRRHIASAAELTEADGPLLGRLFAVAADLARSEGIADGGYRLVSNVGRWGGQTVDHLHVHLMGGRAVRLAARMTGADAADAAVALALPLGVAVLLAACGTTEAPSGSLPAASVAPGRTVSPAVNQTRIELVRALGAHNLVLTDSQAPVRPAEAPLLAAAPRAVYQVILPKDPSHGFIVVYEFRDPARAAAAAAEEQAYLATGPARVQTPLGTVSIIRQVGSTVVFYNWLPQGSLEDLGAGDPGGARDARGRLPGRELGAAFRRPPG